jgi:hypothetical protein
MIENHKLTDTGVRIVLERGGIQREFLYGEDCAPEFLHFAWSADSRHVALAWRDGLCRTASQPALRAWDVRSSEEIPVDDNLKHSVAESISREYFATRNLTPDFILDWATAGNDRHAWPSLHPEPWWICPQC